MSRELEKRLNIARLIAERMSGTATEEDCRKLDEWLSESPDHAKELERIRLEVLKGRPECPELDDMWQEFEKRIHRGSFRWKRWVGYVALFLMPLCIAAWLFTQEKPESSVAHVVEQEKIVPGGVKAQLILADGQTMNICRDTELEVCEGEDARISTTGEMLQYEQSKVSISENAMRYNTLIVPTGGEFSLQLSDGTRIWLNAGSKLKYPVVFAQNVREVEITGEGYFEVEHDEARPFIVKVNGVAVQVLGTSFNISSYADEVVTTLVTGRVSLTKGEHKVELQPDEQAVLEPGETDFKVVKVNAQNYTLWKEGVFWFENSNLETIMNYLARWYDVDVFYTNPELKILRFSVEMKRYEDIDTVLRKIQYTGKVRFDIKGRTVIIQ